MKSIFGFGIPAALLSCTFSLAGVLMLAPGQLSAQTTTPSAQPGQTQRTQDEAAARKELAREQLRRQEHQRILGVIPEFNTFNETNAAALSAKEKFSLALKTAVDPATFLTAAITAGFGQATDSYHDYGQGMQGFGKYMGASYADSFDGTLLGNALFPALLHEDPRYFRKGTGTFKSRFAYSVLTTVRCRSDSGKWVPNFGNLMGNLAAGGIANLYYPEEDRGATLTVERALVVTAEGALGSLFYEFWPDLVRKVHKKKP
ncbi:MAG: hypothetical protein JWP08_4336 [Bryobacterales bacterium]|nr:hypothetical protein [Bryobacterales bacterium]